MAAAISIAISAKIKGIIAKLLDVVLSVDYCKVRKHIELHTDKYRKTDNYWNRGVD